MGILCHLRAWPGWHPSRCFQQNSGSTVLSDRNLGEYHTIFRRQKNKLLLYTVSNHGPLSRLPPSIKHMFLITFTFGCLLQTWQPTFWLMMGFSCFIWNMSINHIIPPPNLETIVKPFVPGSGSEWWGCQGPCGSEMLLWGFPVIVAYFGWRRVYPLGSWFPVLCP